MNVLLEKNSGTLFIKRRSYVLVYMEDLLKSFVYRTIYFFLDLETKDHKGTALITYRFNTIIMASIDKIPF